MSISAAPVFPSRHECDLNDFVKLVQQRVHASEYPLADHIADGVPVYDASGLAAGPTGDSTQREALKNELAVALTHGPGIIVLRGGVDRRSTRRASDVFWRLIERQRQAGEAAGDHFAKPGANDRLWNALEKLAVEDPEAFIDYHRSDAIAVACEAWLGPRYQVTEQVNVVNPGGAAQQPHRDYHMGFLTDNEAEQFPRHAHLLSPLLTLQGAIAHCEMGTETGPTMYLPHSHKYPLGYLAWRRPEFIEYFANHRVQLSLSEGDAVFFSPALFHAAGENITSDFRRLANLLQISSAFGRATEAVDRTRMVRALYPALLARMDAGLGHGAAANVVAASAEGYSFPTNLDRDPPIGGLAPPSQADLVMQALAERWPPDRLDKQLDSYTQRHLSAVDHNGSSQSHVTANSTGHTRAFGVYA